MNDIEKLSWKIAVIIAIGAYLIFYVLPKIIF